MDLGKTSELVKERVPKKCVFCFILVCGIILSVFQIIRANDSNSESDSASETKQSDNEKNVMNEEQKIIYQKIKKTYDVEEQTDIAKALEEEKKCDNYTPENMLIKYNPYGTNTLSLYVYFNTDSPVSVTYTVHVDDENISDFIRTAYQDSA